MLNSRFRHRKVLITRNKHPVDNGSKEQNESVGIGFPMIGYYPMADCTSLVLEWVHTVQLVTTVDRSNH